jgi:EAL domain-containing protein (putative c-di-GMP-specific phosphodiesterase class I)
MYEAKAAGGNAYRFFDQEMSRRAQTAATLEAELHTALAEGQFVAHYQPMFHARTGAIVAAEALLRWQHPVRGLLGPGAFLRVAEETGMILPIGRWMLGEACRQQARWSREGALVPRVSVNLSALQFERQEMAKVVQEVLAETGVAASALELEIVESVLLNNRAAVADTLRTLRGSACGSRSTISGPATRRCNICATCRWMR